jgi:hypothetical protein
MSGNNGNAVKNIKNACESFCGAMHGLGITDVKAAVKKGYHAEGCDFFIDGKKFFVIDEETLIIGVKLDSDEALRLDPLHFALDIVALGVNSRKGYDPALLVGKFRVQAESIAVKALKACGIGQYRQIDSDTYVGALHLFDYSRSRTIGKGLYRSFLRQSVESFGGNFIGEDVGVKIYYHFFAM